MLERSGSSVVPDDLPGRILLGAGGAVGEGFFVEAAKALAEVFGVRWVLFGHYALTGEKSANTIAFWDRRLAENNRFPLRHSIWEHLLETGDCIFADRLRTSFPKDSAIGQMGAEGCVGRQIRGTDGAVIGFATVLDDKPIAEPEAIERALALLSPRAGAELERLIERPLMERLGRIIEESFSEAYVFSADTFRFEIVNRGARENLGYTMEELVRMSPWDIKPDHTEESLSALVAPLLAGEDEAIRFESRHRRKDGTCYDVAVRLQYFAQPDHVFFASINDITQRREAERRERVLMGEVNHRSKNMLALVQAIAQQTANGPPGAFQERLAALAANQDVLVRNSWRCVPVASLVRSQLGFLGPLIDTRVELAGPAVALTSRAAQVLGMALHELATNAIKYGALSGEAGRVRIAWEIGEGLFRFAWRETGGPKVREPRAQGFGSVLMLDQPRYALAAEARWRFEPEGLAYDLAAAANVLLDTDGAERG